MASISPPLPLSTRAMQAHGRPDMYKTQAKQQPSLLEKLLTVCRAPYKKLSGSVLRF